jgi:molybdopterin-containing oxidoreductase family iron-sulfur binding subunit
MRRREFLRLALSSILVLVSPVRVLAGRQKAWAMAIDVEKCIANKGCNDCVEACHETHNVPSMPEKRHEIKWIWLQGIEEVLGAQKREDFKEKEVPVMCNHCDNPPCVKVCPTKATWRREDGVVMMDYHRCIGCRYCMAACPYGARSFNFLDPEPYIKNLNMGFPRRTKGVVEKCNFCEERLAKDLLPICVLACKEKALLFGDVNDPESEIGRLLRKKMALSRKGHLGTRPRVFYVF